jgi:hypothetical protein
MRGSAAPAAIPRLRVRRAHLLAAAVLAAVMAGGCGKKGAPLAPLHLVPAAATDVSARRIEDRVRLRFVLPSRNQNGPGINLDRVEIYAVTVPPGGSTPPNRELLTKPYLAGQISVKPVAGEDTRPVENAAADPRPAPGAPVVFVEDLTTLPPPPAPRKAVVDPSAPPAFNPEHLVNPKTGMPAVDPRKVRYPVRVYVVRGVARNGRGGPPSPRVEVPIGLVPDPPGGLAAKNTEKAVVLEWLPVVDSAAPGVPARAYNVYRAESPDEPLNAAPLESATFELTGVPLGTELCVRVRSVDASSAILVESAMSAPACVTPLDEFPPAPPKGLAAVTTPGAIQLIWDASTEADLAGYLVLRADAPDETLQPLTPAPIRDAVYRDASVKPGIRYVYAIVAVDSAARPNRSLPSERVAAEAR